MTIFFHLSGFSGDPSQWATGVPLLLIKLLSGVIAVFLWVGMEAVTLWITVKFGEDEEMLTQQPSSTQVNTVPSDTPVRQKKRLSELKFTPRRTKLHELLHSETGPQEDKGH